MAVYTDIADEELTCFLARYDVGELLSYKGIAEGVENSNFLLHTSRGSYILTLYEKRVDPGDLPFFLGLKDHLAEAGFPCPVPIRNQDGNQLGHLAGRPAALISFLEGMWLRRHRADHCRQLGEALANMHNLAGGFKISRPNALSVEGWRPLFAMSAEQADSVEKGLRAEIEAELDTLEAQWPVSLPTGVIHADLFPDNVFFLRDKLAGFIDFYFACNDILAYDIAICLNAWCFEPDGMFNVTKARGLIDGYQSVRKLSDAEITALPLLARGSALRFLLTRLYDWLTVPEGALVVPKNPTEYLKKMRFHRSISSPSSYGVILK